MEDNKSKIGALATSLLFHGGILALFLLFSFKVDKPLVPEDEGIMVSLGSVEDGGNSNELADIGDPPIEHPVTKTVPSATEEKVYDADEESETDITSKQNEENKKKSDVKPPVENQTQKQTENKTQTQNKTQEERKVDQNALFKKSNKTGNPNGNEGGDPNSPGKGNGNKSGNEGMPNGDPNGDPDGKGKGDKGDGNGRINLTGRKLIEMPSSDCGGQSTGKVVIKIFVDRSGKVVDAKIDPRTTNPDSKTKECCRLNSKKARFAPNPEAEEIQEGTITYNITIN